MMFESLLIVAGGLLGSSHCVGMCGGFVLALGGSSGRHGMLTRQLLYGFGRVFTYVCLGAAAGFAGWRMSASLRTLLDVQAWLCIAAGVLLIGQGLHSLGLLPLGRLTTSRAGCLGPPLFGSLLGATRARSVFLGGVINGLLPCGLVYGYLALAGSSGGLLGGMTVMALFGLGTVPVLALVGCGGGLMSLTSRGRLMKAAAVCVVLTGVLTIGRGAVFLTSSTQEPGAACPLCSNVQ